MLASAQCQAGRRGIHKQCSNTDFYKHLRSVTAACAFSAPQHEQLRSLFMSSPDNGGVFVHDSAVWSVFFVQSFRLRSGNFRLFFWFPI